MLALPAERSILTIHDLVFLHTYKGITRKFLKWIFLDLPVKKARTITTISEKSKQEILQHSTCTPGKVHLIPNPVDPALAAPNINPISTPVDQTQSTQSTHHQSISNTTAHAIPRILFLGTKPNKNLELSIEALYTLNIHLRIIGNITAQQHLLLKKFNIDYSAAQHLSDAELINEYHQADIILFPSTYEGFGLPLLEGFQSGKPVITSNIPPMSDIAGNAALLVDPFSLDSIRGGIKQLLQDVSLRNELVKRGFEKASAYHPTIIASQYVDLWKQNDIFS
jgi:glycosyltransferase involved in cell wall biosynthesis